MLYIKLDFLESLSCSDGTVGGRDMKGVGVKTPRRPLCPFSGLTPEHGVETQTLCDGMNFKPNIFENLFSLKCSSALLHTLGSCLECIINQEFTFHFRNCPLYTVVNR